jgi:inosine-uridine nucleoside N-ribohydrolase
MTRHVLRPQDGLNWLSITMVPVDVAYTAPWTAQFLAKLKYASSSSRVAQYLYQCAPPPSIDTIGFCDEMAVALLIDRTYSKASPKYVDVDTTSGIGSGNTLSWSSIASLPQMAEIGLASVYFSVNVTAFYAQLGALFDLPTLAPLAGEICGSNWFTPPRKSFTASINE